MLDFYQIKDIGDRWFERYMRIYSKSFPIYEQRDRMQHEIAFNSRYYKLLCSIENDEIVSFVSFWDFEEFVYIEHLAVNDIYRGKGFGSQMLTQFEKLTQKTIILEIDPITDDLSRNRLTFYQKLGFKLCLVKHTHPPYKKSYEPHELLVLNTGDNALSLEQYNAFNNALKTIVMR